MPETMLQASNASELDAALAAIDTDVPLRSERRTKQHTERYACVHLLATFPLSTWTFPLRVVHGDRPDFVVQQASRWIGIEHVEAVSENEAHASFLREKRLGPDAYFIQPATPGERKRRAARLRAEIEANEVGEPWEGGSAEQQWAEAMAYFIRDKVQTSQIPGFQRFPENWLLIYDNWPLPVIKPERAAQKLVTHAALAKGLEGFGRILILDDATLWDFAPYGLTIRPLVRPASGFHEEGPSKAYSPQPTPDRSKRA